jgi:hypothetical protein
MDPLSKAAVSMSLANLNIVKWFLPSHWGNQASLRWHYDEENDKSTGSEKKKNSINISAYLK